MKFISHGRRYEADKFGCIRQVDAKPFAYDEAYARIYDRPEYANNSEKLQSLRLGFVIGSSGASSLLDVGCGNGAFIKEAQKTIPCVFGKDGTGLKIDGCRIVDTFVPAEVYTFWDVIEHMDDLSILRGLPCDTICVSTPFCHVNHLGIKWFDNYHHRKPDEHVRHFDVLSLVLTMSSLGWRDSVISNFEDSVRGRRNGLWNIISMSFKRK